MNSLKILFVSLLLFGLKIINAQSAEKFDSTIWVKNFEQAKLIAIDKKLPIVLVFSGSDWCKPCIKLKTQILLTDSFSAYAKDHFVMLNLDFPSKKVNKLSSEQQKHNDELAAKYNIEGVFPLLLILDNSYKVITSSGYIDVKPEEYIKNLESLLKNKYHE